MTPDEIIELKPGMMVTLNPGYRFTEYRPPVFVLSRGVDFEGERHIGVFASCDGAQRYAAMHAREYSGHEEPATWIAQESAEPRRWDWRLFDSGEYIIRKEKVQDYSDDPSKRPPL